MLRSIDDSRGCSIKDSFASVDLSGDGFRLLFEAEWIHREPPRDPGKPLLSWSVVREADELSVWATAHGGGEIFGPDLLDDPAVATLAAHDGGGLVAGVIGNRSASVAGLSNLFVRNADSGRVWRKRSMPSAPSSLAYRWSATSMARDSNSPAVPASSAPARCAGG